MSEARVMRIIWATMTRTRVSAGKAQRQRCSRKGVSGETVASEWKIGQRTARNSIRI